MDNWSVIKALISALLPRVTVYLSENTVMEVIELNGRLLKVRGIKAKVEQLELDHVRISQGTKEYYLELSDNVRWVPQHV